MQPWLAAASSYSPPGPKSEAGSRDASCRKYPPWSNSITWLTQVGGYQNGEPYGQDEIISQGEILKKTEKLPAGVGSAGRPVVTGVASTTQPSWKATSSWRERETRIDLPLPPCPQLLSATAVVACRWRAWIVACTAESSAPVRAALHAEGRGPYSLCIAAAAGAPSRLASSSW